VSHDRGQWLVVKSEKLEKRSISEKGTLGHQKEKIEGVPVYIGRCARLVLQQKGSQFTIFPVF
jgi:hypothetical protein